MNIFVDNDELKAKVERKKKIERKKKTLLSPSTCFHKLNFEKGRGKIKGLKIIKNSDAIIHFSLAPSQQQQKKLSVFYVII